MRFQASPVKNKVEFVRARLDRLAVEGDVARDADELMRRKILYEYVSFVRCKLESTLNRSQGSRGDQEQVGASIRTSSYR